MNNFRTLSLLAALAMPHLSAMADRVVLGPPNRCDDLVACIKQEAFTAPGVFSSTVPNETDANRECIARARNLAMNFASQCNWATLAGQIGASLADPNRSPGSFGYSIYRSEISRTQCDTVQSWVPGEGSLGGENSAPVPTSGRFQVPQGMCVIASWATGNNPGSSRVCALRPIEHCREYDRERARMSAEYQLAFFTLEAMLLSQCSGNARQTVPSERDLAAADCFDKHYGDSGALTISGFGRVNAREKVAAAKKAVLKLNQILGVTQPTPQQSPVPDASPEPGPTRTPAPRSAPETRSPLVVPSGLTLK